MKKLTKSEDLKPVTQAQLNERLTATEERFDTKLEYFTGEIVQTISDLFNDKIDKIATTQDKILLKLETWEQENSVGAEQTRELSVAVDNHEKRITTLEAAKN